MPVNTNAEETDSVALDANTVSYYLLDTMTKINHGICLFISLS